MFKEHASFRPPADKNASVWRYLSFAKFVDLLDRNALYFARADRFDDAWEGTMPIDVSFPREHVTEEQEAILRKDSYNFLQACSYLNCWHLAESESLAMWRIYNGDEVAVRSTYQRIVDAICVVPEEVRIGTVSYGQMHPASYTRSTASFYGSVKVSPTNKSYGWWLTSSLTNGPAARSRLRNMRRR